MPESFAFIKRWWLAPLLIAVLLAALAVVFRDQPPDYVALKQAHAAAARELAPVFARADGDVRRVRVVQRSVLSQGGDSHESIVTTTFTALGDGWFARRDDWRDKFDQALLFEQRTLTFRGLFNVHFQERTVAPMFFHTVFGSLGWFEESSVSTTIARSADFADAEGSQLTVTQQRVANNDGQSVGHAPSTYQRTQRCTRDKAVEGAKVHASLRVPLRQMQCVRESNDSRTQGSSSLVEVIPDTLYLLTASRTPLTFGERTTSGTIREIEIERGK